MESPFAVLGVSPDADEAEIRRAYRERVKEAHPDQGGSIDEFIAVRTAYERLLAGEGQQGLPADEGAPSAEDGDTDDDEDDEYVAPTTEVTYLNYDVLTDHGWDPYDDELFEKAADADLAAEDYGQFTVEPDESVLEAAERSEYAWPFACRGGACANCAVLLCEGEVAMPVNHVLPTEMMERDVRLSCNAMPITDELKLVYNLKHMPDLEELLLPPRPFEQTYAGD